MPPSPTKVGRYQIRQRLAHGGMGVLYLAFDPATDRLVAVKLLRANNPEMRERFLREARFAARLQHPNIVTVYDVGAHEGQPFIAMEYIPGETVAELVHRRAVLPLLKRLLLMHDVCVGLAYAHRQGIVHRDIKPANLMVSRESGAVKILDFGVARGAEPGVTQAGTLMGTPNYMSPEQVAGEPVDHRSDIFAVGLVLYELLTFRQAFSGDSPHAVLLKVLNEAPEPLTAIDSSLDPALMGIVNRAVEKVVQNRYEDLDVMRADLERVIQRLEAPETVPRAASSGPAAQRPSRGPRGNSREARLSWAIDAAETALARDDIEGASASLAQAVRLDPADARLPDLQQRLAASRQARELAKRVADTKREIAVGALTQAGQLLEEVLNAAPNTPEAQALARAFDRALEDRDRRRERVRKVEVALEHARQSLRTGSLEAAQRATNEALGYDPDSADALALYDQVQAAIEARARDALGAAEQDAYEGRLSSAIGRLEQFVPRTEEIEDAIERYRQTLAEKEPASPGEPKPARALANVVRSHVGGVRAALAGGRWEEAHDLLVALERQIPLGDDTVPIMRSGSAAIVDSGRVAEVQRDHELAHYLVRARQRLASGDVSAALSLVDAALSLTARE